MDFRILGPIEAHEEERPVALGAPKQRALLGLLLVHAPNVVSVDRILDALWGDSPPAGGAGTVQFHVSRLRSHLAAAGAAGLVVTEAPGYRLAVDAAAIDARRFEEAAAHGRELIATDADGAAATLREALDLWRGPALADLAYEEFARDEIRRLEELRLQAHEDRIDADLRRGLHTELVGELEALVSAHPLRERPRELMMLALYRAGRQAEALRAFQDARSYFGEELGIEPSERLRDVESQILVQDPELVEGSGGSRLPGGVVTFLFAEVVDATRLWEEWPEEMRPVMAIHDQLAGAAIGAHGGLALDHVGDGMVAVFPEAERALRAAVDIQRRVPAERWPAGLQPSVRIGLHSGEVEPTGEHYHGSVVNRGARIMAAAHGGQVLASGVTVELARSELGEEFLLYDLGLHRLRDVERPAHLFQVSDVALDTDVSPPASLDTHRHNLPTSPTPFLGRADVLARTAEALASARLVTLVGTGGAGKTRVALQAGADEIERRRDGVWFVRLDNVRVPAEVGVAVLNAVGAPPLPARTVFDAAAAWAEQHRALVILDNCEHVVDAAARVAQAMLTGGPDVSVLATSRRPLGVPGESLVEVAPMALPPEGAGPEAVVASEAGLLFAERAFAVDARFRITDANAPAVASVCRRLDGIPLALELAAARLRLLSPAELDERLQDRFRLLTARARAAPARQATLEAAVSWSYELLDDAERALFETLAVFRGSFDVLAVEAVGDAAWLGGRDPTDVLGELVDHSLVAADHAGHGGRRFRFLETIREYAAARLEASGLAGEAAARHARVYAERALAAAPELTGTDEAGWFGRIEADFPNLRQAVDHLLETGDTATVLAMASALKPFFMARDPLGSFGRAWVDESLANAEGEDPVLIAAGLVTAGLLAWNVGDYADAEKLQREALRIARETGDDHLVFQAVSDLGMSAVDHGELAEARLLFEEALELARSWGDPAHLASAVANLAQVAARADQKELLDEALALHEEAGRASGIAHIALMQGYLALADGLLDDAAACFEASRAAWADLGNAAAAIVASCGAADAARLRGEPAAGAAIAREAMEAAAGIEFELGRACALASLGAAERSNGEVGPAREHLEHAAALWRRVGMAAGEARSLGLLACIAAEAGESQVAEEHLNRAEELWATVNRASGLGWAVAMRAACSLARGDAEAAVGAAERAVVLLRQAARGPAVLDGLLAPETGGAADLVDVCEILGMAAVRCGHGPSGTRLLSAADRFRRDTGVAAAELRVRRVRAALDAARRELGQDAFEAAVKAGRRESADLFALAGTGVVA